MFAKIITVLAYLASALLLVSGVRWQLDPAAVAAELGMPLLDGVGLSTQIGDLTAFFVTAGGFGLAGLIRRDAKLLYPSIALVGFAALFRTSAWMFHDAALAPQIVPEIVMCLVFFLAARQVAKNSA